MSWALFNDPGVVKATTKSFEVKVVKALLRWSLWHICRKAVKMRLFLGSFWCFQCSQLVTKSRGTKNQFPILQFGLIWFLQEFLVSGSLVTWELQVFSASCWKQWHARPTWILKQLWFRGVCACVLRFRHGTLSNLPCSGASNQYDKHPAASRSPLFDTARAFAAVYVSIYLPLFEWGCFFGGSCIKACLVSALLARLWFFLCHPWNLLSVAGTGHLIWLCGKLYQLPHGSSYSGALQFWIDILSILMTQENQL